MSQGEPAFQNTWAIFTNSYSEPVLHHITDKNTWQSVKSINESNEAIEMDEIFAGEDYELWGIHKRTNSIFRRVLRKVDEFYPETIVWERIFTPENKIRAISACNVLNVWLLLDSPYANRSRVCKLTLSPPNWAQKPIEGFFNEKKYFDFTWNFINVDKTLQALSVNYRGELWAADSAGKLYQRISSSLEAFSSISSNQLGSSSLYRSKSDNLQSNSFDFQSDFDDFKDSSASSVNSSRFPDSEVIQSLDENLDVFFSLFFFIIFIFLIFFLFPSPFFLPFPFFLPSPSPSCFPSPFPFPSSFPPPSPFPFPSLLLSNRKLSGAKWMCLVELMIVSMILLSKLFL